MQPGGGQQENLVDNNSKRNNNKINSLSHQHDHLGRTPAHNFVQLQMLSTDLLLQGLESSEMLELQREYGSETGSLVLFMAS